MCSSRLIGLISLWLLLGGVLLPGQTLPRTPYEHRALYLFNFAKFASWPKESFPTETSPFILGILGQDPFGSDLDLIKGKSVKGRKLVVKYFARVEEVSECHLLFISDSERSHLAEIVAALEKRSILTVTEVDETAPPRGMINLVVENNKLGFEIDQKAAEKAGLKLDTQLLRLARTVNHRKENR